MTDEQIQTFHACAAACQRAVEAIAETLRTAFEAVMDACRKLYTWFHDRYVEAGVVYGDTHEGMLRWYEELARVARLLSEAAYLEERHQTLREIRSGAWRR